MKSGVSAGPEAENLSRFPHGVGGASPAVNWWLLNEQHQTSVSLPSPRPSLGLIPEQPNRQRQQLGYTPHRNGKPLSLQHARSPSTRHSSHPTSSADMPNGCSGAVMERSGCKTEWSHSCPRNRTLKHLILSPFTFESDQNALSITFKQQERKREREGVEKGKEEGE